MLGEAHMRTRSPLEPAPQLYAHSRTRTTSSGIFPSAIPPPMPTHLQQPQPQMGHNRRSPSVGTFSTVSSNTPPAAFRNSSASDLRRSISSRSGGGSSASYVAILRKQKATVWCDRAQYEDPRLVAQQRAAKQRADIEVIRGTSGRTSTGISGAGKMVGKIRHHGKPGVVGYAPENNYVGVTGVPMRLSATEVENEDSDDDGVTMSRAHHRRTGSSGRSSTTSSRRALAYRSSGSIGQSGKRWSPSDTPERRGSTVTERPEYEVGDDRDPLDRATSTRSGSSEEKADALPELNKGGAAKLASNSLLNAALTREKSVRNPEDLKRRGSVDERTMTLTAGRLYIANPD